MQRIMDAVECVLEFLEKSNYSEDTFARYKLSYTNSIMPYCEANGIDDFTDEDARFYTAEQVTKVEKGELGISSAWKRRKAAALLADCMNGKKLVFEQKNYNQKQLTSQFKKILADFTTSTLHLYSPSSILKYECIIKQFLVYVERSGMEDISKLTPENVKEFIALTAQNHKSSMSALTGTIKKFLTYLNVTGLVAINAERYLSNPAPRRRKLLPCFTDNEVDAILNAVDRGTPLGKRDYAIMMTALWTGLRCSDVFQLERSDIDWAGMTINVCQEKTDVLIQTELPPSVGNSIADYILKGRPQTDIPYVFIRHKKPYDKLGISSGSVIVNKYLEISGVPHKAWDGKTFHAFRRTFGTRLVRADVPIRTISEMLGQLNENSAKRYIALDNDGLRKCCLNASEYATKKEGLV